MPNKENFFWKHIAKWLFSASVIFGSSLIVRNNNSSMVTLVIVVVCTTVVILLIPTLADIIHKLLDDFDMKG